MNKLQETAPTYANLDDDLDEGETTSADPQRDLEAAAAFDSEKRDACVNLFLEHYPAAKDYEVADFVGRARRSYVRAARQGVNEASWDERLRRHVATFRFIGPLQRELEKLTYNQKLVELEIERAKVAKAKAELEKDKIDFLNEQAEFVRTGKSPYYGHLTTIARLEEAKHNVETRYRAEVEELKAKQDEALKTAVGAEVTRIKQHYDERFYKLSRFYELFKEKYRKLKEVNGKMLFDLNAKMQEAYGLQFRIGQLNGAIKEREAALDQANREIEAKTKIIDEFREQQPSVIEEAISDEVETRMRAQTEKLNNALLEKEKTLLGEVEARRAEIEATLAKKAAEVERLVAAVSELEKALEKGTEELARVREDYDFAARSNRELTEAVKVLQADNEKLAKDLETALAEKADTEKLNGLLVRKYRDGEERTQTEKKIDSDAEKIIKGQEELGRLLRRRMAAEERRAYRKIKNRVEGVSAPRRPSVAEEAQLPAPVAETVVRKAVFVPTPKEQPSEPVKRKRGRPRKHPLPEASAPFTASAPIAPVADDDSLETKRKRSFSKLVDIE